MKWYQVFPEPVSFCSVKLIYAQAKKLCMSPGMTEGIYGESPRCLFVRGGGAEGGGWVVMEKSTKHLTEFCTASNQNHKVTKLMIQAATSTPGHSPENNWL